MEYIGYLKVNVPLLPSVPLQSLSLSARNLFGRAEQLRVVSATTLPHWGQTMQLQFSKPYYRNIDKK